jgi:hypothetical protein
MLGKEGRTPPPAPTLNETQVGTCALCSLTVESAIDDENAERNRAEPSGDGLLSVTPGQGPICPGAFLLPFAAQ